MNSTKFLYLSFVIVAVISVIQILLTNMAASGKIVCIVAAIFLEALILILLLHFRSDIYHDYLRDTLKHYGIRGKYVNRQGMCFTCWPTIIDGVAYMEMFFQSQYDSPCHAEISLRPPRGFFLQKSELEPIYYTIDCPSAGFGVARIPIAIEAQRQGKLQAYDIGATVKYPLGKGKRIRFREGITIRSAATTSDFNTTVKPALRLLVLLPLGILLPSHQAQFNIMLPENVAETLPDEQPPQQETEILWRSGDEPLEVEWETA